MKETSKPKRLLFLDDDAGFLEGIRQLFTAMSRGAWEISTAGSHAQALKQLSQQAADVLVLDIGMPVIDGIEFLRLVRRTHPAQSVVMLTGKGDEANRKACQELGAALFLEKPATREGFEAVYAALDALAGETSGGFRGVMRRVGLQEVLQIECLGHKSSVLEVFTPETRGRIYISEGSIVHAESGSFEGEMALYGLLGLKGGEFNLQGYVEPPRRTISGHYEFLLMEAARLNDEGTNFFKAKPPLEPLAEPAPARVAGVRVGAAAPGRFSHTTVEEIVLCSGSGEALYDWNTAALQSRLALLAQVDQQAAELGGLLPLGRFERLEIRTESGRIICQVQPHMRLFVRSAVSPARGQ